MIPHGIMFHHFHDEKIHPPGQGSITAEELKDILKFYGKTNTILSAEDWYEKAVSNKLSSDDICLTFDDNLRCQFDIALPVLESLNLRVFWFIYTSPFDNIIEGLEVYRYFRSTAFKGIDEFYDAFYHLIRSSSVNSKVEKGFKSFPEDYLMEYAFYSKPDRIFRYIRDCVLTKKEYAEIMEGMISASGMDIKRIKDNLWMDKDCLRLLKEKGHFIGLHSHTHPTLMNQLSRKDQEFEYKTNYSKIKGIIGNDIVSMSHPCNSYNAVTLEILNELGIKIAFRADMRLKKHSRLEFARIDHAYLVKELRKK